jgi:ketosteroid isomerase-like protein
VSASSNVQMIHDHFAAKERLDRDTLRKQFTDDAMWWTQYRVPNVGWQHGGSNAPTRSPTYSRPSRSAV